MAKFYKAGIKDSAAKKTAWIWFARYIKLRDALATTGTADYCKCITCGAVKPIEETDAGHMIPGRTNAILFDETIVHGQCIQCNRHGGGEVQAYKIIMVKKHGEAWYEIKTQARKTPVSLDDNTLRIIAKEYRQRYNELKKQTT